jgi:8-oxo-dGTP pyrophosphatase MutT (NUDIX family)
MTTFEIGVVDVLVFRGAPAGGEVLVMRRAEGTRCTGAWEVVHGRIEPGERPEDAAVREVLEETGLTVDRLYNLTCQPFYLHRLSSVQLAVVFVAFVAEASVPSLGEEHDRAEWLSATDAMARLDWPRSVAALRDAVTILRDGHAGPVEDVLRVR